MNKCRNLRYDKDGNPYCCSTHVCYREYCQFDLFGKLSCSDVSYNPDKL